MTGTGRARLLLSQTQTEICRTPGPTTFTIYFKSNVSILLLTLFIICKKKKSNHLTVTSPPFNDRTKAAYDLNMNSLSSCQSLSEKIKDFLSLRPARWCTWLKTCENLTASVSLGPTARWGKLNKASGPISVTSVVKANWQDHGKFLTRQRSSCKMSSFSFTLLYQFTKTGAVSVCPGKSLPLLVSVVIFL